MVEHPGHKITLDSPGHIDLTLKAHPKLWIVSKLRLDDLDRSQSLVNLVLT
jgi:hypothetical protein